MLPASHGLSRCSLFDHCLSQGAKDAETSNSDILQHIPRYPDQKCKYRGQLSYRKYFTSVSKALAYWRWSVLWKYYQVRLSLSQGRCNPTPHVLSVLQVRTNA